MWSVGTGPQPAITQTATIFPSLSTQHVTRPQPVPGSWTHTKTPFGEKREKN